MFSAWSLGRKIAVVAGTVLALCAVLLAWAWYDFTHNFKLVFSTPTEQEVAPFKSAIAAAVVVKQPGTPSLWTSSKPYSEMDFRTDAKLFDTWRLAVTLGNATLKSTASGNWLRTSSTADYVSSEDKLDPWGHSFCLLRRGDQLLVISAGPSAPSSPTCKDTRVSEQELSRLPRKKLLQSPGGHLLLALDKSVVTSQP